MKIGKLTTRYLDFRVAAVGYYVAGEHTLH